MTSPHINSSEMQVAGSFVRRRDSSLNGSEQDKDAAVYLLSAQYAPPGGESAYNCNPATAEALISSPLLEIYLRAESSSKHVLIQLPVFK